MNSTYIQKTDFVGDTMSCFNARAASWGLFGPQMMLKSIFLKYRHTLLNITQSILKGHIKSLIHGDIPILVCL